MQENDSFPAWGAGISGLRKTRDNFWESDSAANVSFPESGHSSLVEIEQDSYWFNHRNDIIAAVVRRFPPDGPVFDIGGGNGYVSVGLKRAGFDCVVIEPGPAGAANAAARGFPVIRAPFQDLAVDDNALPAAGMFDVLEHIEDDAAALRNLYRVLKPGGRLYIAVPAHQLLWSKEDVYAGHFRRYRLRDLCQGVKAAGFTVDYSTYFFAALLLPIFLLRALPSRFGIGQAPGGGNARRDHSLSGGLGRILRASFSRELAKVSAGGTPHAGASCLVVARKP